MAAICKLAISGQFEPLSKRKRRPSRPFDASLAVEQRRDFFAVAVTGVSARRFFAPVVGTGVCSSTAGVSAIEAFAGVVGESSAGVAG
ncbi:hypothetical protein PsorP6_017392 [Peronosclerospora sorghi]|uniref:Uncharacterized protein n=1 Tax=Peronosclerospora sorghi TaxID=230839 RepID=A0ACC0WL74_9STRA|nr:hypothetical protein PsorP6_017392 [Peronosclerospora sorghi]